MEKQIGYLARNKSGQLNLFSSLPIKLELNNDIIWEGDLVLTIQNDTFKYVTYMDDPYKIEYTIEEINEL